MQRHFVTFYSPGTIVAETTTKEIDSWNVDDAVAMARGIQERHGARPYGFRFSTRARSETDLDSKEVDRSPMYYLGGIVRTAAEVLAGTDPSESTLRVNVKFTNMKRVITSNTPWRWSRELHDDDIVLDAVAAN